MCFISHIFSRWSVQSSTGPTIEAWSPNESVRDLHERTPACIESTHRLVAPPDTRLTHQLLTAAPLKALRN